MSQAVLTRPGAHLATVRSRSGLLRQPALCARPASLHPARRSVAARAGKKVTGEELEVEIQERDRPIIVDFYATWCGPCLLLAQELDKVQSELGDEVKILKVDVDENPALSSQLRIEGLPTVVFIPKDASRPALRTEGLLPAEQILEIVKEMQTGAVPQQSS